MVTAILFLLKKKMIWKIEIYKIKELLSVSFLGILI